MKKLKKVSLYYDLVVGKFMRFYQKEYDKCFDDWMKEALEGKFQFEMVGRSGYTVGLRNLVTGVMLEVWIENHPYASVYAYCSKRVFKNKRGCSLKTTNLFIKHFNSFIDKQIALEDEEEYEEFKRLFNGG